MVASAAPTRSGATRRLDDRSARGLGCTPNRQGATEGGMIIDCHGHYTTAPKELEAYRQKQIADLKEPSRARAKGTLSISDDQIRESIDKAQLRLQRERGTDVTIFSPRAAGMGHHIGDATHQPALVAGVQRPDPSRLHALSPELRGRLPAPADAGRAADQLHPRARALREGVRVHRLQPEPGPVRRLLEGPAAHRQVVVPLLREAGRARRAGDGPREHVVQPELPHDRRPLHQRRHHRVHAAHHRRSLQGLPEPEVHHPARRRRRAVPLGALSRHRARSQEAAPARTTS